MLVAEIGAALGIREAEPWNPLSILAGLLLLSGLCFLVWKLASRP